MINDFEQFLSDLGPGASRYTPAELRRLHVEVQKISELLIEVYWTDGHKQRKRRSPQMYVDAAYGRRTIESSAQRLTLPDKAQTSSADPP